MNLVRGDRLIGSAPHPRAHGAAESLLLELRDDALHSTVLFYQAIYHCRHFGAHHPA